MAEVTFRLNPNWRRQVEELVKPALRDVAEKRTQQYEELVLRHGGGGNVETIKTELVSFYRADGGELTEPELTKHAEAIAAGTRIVFRA